MDHNKKPTLKDIVVGTLKELRKDVKFGAEVTKEFLYSATCTIGAPYAIPTAIRSLMKNEKDLDDRIKKNPGLMGGLVGGTIIDLGQGLFYLGHPKYLIIPAASNAISLTYEGLRAYKGRLEEELEKELSTPEFIAETAKRSARGLVRYSREAGGFIYDKAQRALKSTSRAVVKASGKSGKFMAGFVSGAAAINLALYGVPTAYRLYKEHKAFFNREDAFGYGFAFGAALGCLGVLAQMSMYIMPFVDPNYPKSAPNQSPLIPLITNATSLVFERARKVNYQLRSSTTPS